MSLILFYLTDLIRLLIQYAWRPSEVKGGRMYIKWVLWPLCTSVRGLALDWASSWDFLLLSRVFVPLSSSTPLAVMALAFSSSSQRCRYCCRARFSAATASFCKTHSYSDKEPRGKLGCRKSAKPHATVQTILFCSLLHCSLNSRRHLSISFRLADKPFGKTRYELIRPLY